MRKLFYLIFGDHIVDFIYAVDLGVLHFNFSETVYSEIKMHKYNKFL